jgi:large conductance mechanosensitive channel
MAAMTPDSIGAGLRAGGRGVTGLLRDFEAFLLRGNVVDLAVGVVIGVAFGNVVTALVKDLITPLIAALGAQPDFGGLAFSLNHSRFRYGDFVDALVSFVIVAAMVFFLVVMPINRLMTMRDRFRKPATPDTRECTECLSQIPLRARRCAYCTSPQVPQEAPASAQDSPTAAARTPG